MNNGNNFEKVVGLTLRVIFPKTQLWSICNLKYCSSELNVSVLVISKKKRNSHKRCSLKTQKLIYIKLEIVEKHIFSTLNYHILVTRSLSFDLSHHLRKLMHFWVFYGHFSGTNPKSQYFASTEMAAIFFCHFLQGEKLRFWVGPTKIAIKN